MESIIGINQCNQPMSVHQGSRSSRTETKSQPILQLRQHDQTNSYVVLYNVLLLNVLCRERGIGIIFNYAYCALRTQVAMAPARWRLKKLDAIPVRSGRVQEGKACKFAACAKKEQRTPTSNLCTVGSELRSDCRIPNESYVFVFAYSLFWEESEKNDPVKRVMRAQVAKC